MKRLNKYLRERWEKITYKDIQKFYFFVGLVTLLLCISCLVIEVWNCYIINIVWGIFLVFLLVLFYLYYLFYDKLEEKKKSEMEKINKEKTKKKVMNMLSVNKPREIFPKHNINNKENSLSEIFLSIKKELSDCECRMEAYLEEDGNIILLLIINNTFDDKFVYTDYNLFLEEWDIN